MGHLLDRFTVDDACAWAQSGALVCTDCTENVDDPCIVLTWADPVTLTELARAALAHTMAAHPADDVVGPL